MDPQTREDLAAEATRDWQRAAEEFDRAHRVATAAMTAYVLEGAVSEVVEAVERLKQAETNLVMAIDRVKILRSEAPLLS